MFTGRELSLKVVAPSLLALMLAACGSPATPTASVSSPPSTSPSAATSPGTSPAAKPTPGVVDVRLVIEDIAGAQVRLAKLDATRTATVPGRFVAIVNDHVIVVNGTTLETIDRAGTVRKLGQLAADPNLNGSGAVAVNPDLSRWIYTIADSAWTTQVHLGTATGDSVVASVPSPDGNAFYAPFAWNAGGIFMSKQATGLGGAGPFLEYRFPLAKLDLLGHRVTDVSPSCIGYGVLDDGTMLCRKSYIAGSIEVRSPSGKTNAIQLTIGTADIDSVFMRLSVSADNRRVMVSRDGARGSVISYQMAVADLSGSSAAAFGPLDYVPDTWLPDGRLVADHSCVISEWGGGPCNTGLDGTYIFSADGNSHVLFFKLQSGLVVGYV